MNKERQSIIIFKDKTFKVVNSKNSWEYENDLDWFATYEVSILLNSLLDVQLDFDTEYLLEEFRKIQDECFSKNGESYKGNILSHSTMELMLQIINGLDNYIKSTAKK